jgi:hypothetical protein
LADVLGPNFGPLGNGKQELEAFLEAKARWEWSHLRKSNWQDN